MPESAGSRHPAKHVTERACQRPIRPEKGTFYFSLPRGRSRMSPFPWPVCDHVLWGRRPWARRLTIVHIFPLLQRVASPKALPLTMVEALDDASTAREKAIVKARGLGDATRRFYHAEMCAIMRPKVLVRSVLVRASRERTEARRGTACLSLCSHEHTTNRHVGAWNPKAVCRPHENQSPTWAGRSLNFSVLARRMGGTRCVRVGGSWAHAWKKWKTVFLVVGGHHEWTVSWTL